MSKEMILTKISRLRRNIDIGALNEREALFTLTELTEHTRLLPQEEQAECIEAINRLALELKPQ